MKKGYLSMTEPEKEADKDRTPTKADVKGIFRDVYNLFLKYERTWSDSEWIDFVNEMKALEKKYPFDLAQEMLLSVADVIEKRYMHKKFD